MYTYSYGPANAEPGYLILCDSQLYLCETDGPYAKVRTGLEAGMLRFSTSDAIWCVLLIAATTGLAQDGSRDAVRFPRYEILNGSLDADGFPTGNARLCIVGSHQCYDLTEHDRSKQSPFGLHPVAREIALPSGANLVLFTATFSGGGSGSLDGIALLEDQRDGKIVDLTPNVSMTEQGEMKIWNEPSISSMPLMVVADFVWSKGETHFAAHKFEIRSLVFDQSSNRYVVRDKYLTAHKYPSLDEADGIKSARSLKKQL